MPYVNNKGTDQPAHLQGLTSTFVDCCLDSTTPLVSISKISSFYLASVAVQADLSLTWVKTLKTSFLVTLNSNNMNTHNGLALQQWLAKVPGEATSL